MIATVGSLNADLVVPVSHRPLPGERRRSAGQGLVRGHRTAGTVNVVAGVTFATLAAFLLQDALTRAIAA
ncbi:hypothetical protein ABZ626_18770 [Streptomyces longispororuber]|uniref:hypothetical protein n=1 Tax=Streptomyces longispororuber TaxID=68230 RepID=UPI0033E4364C